MQRSDEDMNASLLFSWRFSDRRMRNRQLFKNTEGVNGVTTSIRKGPLSMDDKTMELFLRLSMNRMVDHHLPKIRHCLDALNTQQLWEHEVNQTNSVGGILLHIYEQIRRHTVMYEQVGPVAASGIENYFPDLEISPEELAQKVEEAFTLWQGALQELALDESKEIDMHSIYHLVEHTSYHLGQIVDRAQKKTGKAFKFVQNGLNERNLRAIVERVSGT